MGRLLTLALDDDAGATLAGLREIGFVRDGIDVDAQRLLDYLQPFIDPLRTDTFHFSRDWIRDVFAHINDPRKPNYAVGMRLNPVSYTHLDVYKRQVCRSGVSPVGNVLGALGTAGMGWATGIATNAGGGVSCADTGAATAARSGLP